MKLAKRLLIAALALMFLFALCVQASALTPGIYEATALGFRENVTVHVKVDESSILAVDVVKCGEYPQTLVQPALDQVPAAIVEHQSVNVDGVTGATLTSWAIKTATKDALEQAGGAEAFLEAPAKAEIVEGEDVTVDVLVVGAGGAGSMAALGAIYEDFNGVENGKSVMLIEKQGFIGGSTMLSGGGFIAPSSLDANEETLAATVEKAKQIAARKNSGEVNEAMLERMVRSMSDTVIKLQQMGLGLDTTTRYPQEQASGFTNLSPYEEAVTPPPYWPGYQLGIFWERRFDRTSIDLRLNTKALELIVEDGAVVGVKVQDKTSTYNVYAKAVVLATGGFSQNRELIEKYAPANVGAIPFSNGGSTGDGIVMAEAVDAQIVGNQLLGYTGSDIRYGIWDDFSPKFRRRVDGSVHVNAEGLRYADDTLGDDNIEFDNVMAQPGGYAWGIVDSNNKVAPALANTRHTSLVFKADTLEELAEQIGVPADAFVDTITRYNEAQASGQDAEFGSPNAKLRPVLQAPFYAYRINPIALSSLVGLKVTENFEVVNTSGEVVKGLYAAGDMCFGGNLLTTYQGAWGVATALYTGRLAGESARDYAN